MCRATVAEKIVIFATAPTVVIGFSVSQTAEKASRSVAVRPFTQQQLLPFLPPMQWMQWQSGECAADVL